MTVESSTSTRSANDRTSHRILLLLLWMLLLLLLLRLFFEAAPGLETVRGVAVLKGHVTERS